MSCEKCKVDFVGREAIAKCSECEVTFHVACARNFKPKSKNWKCDACRDDASVKSTDEPGEDRRLILEAINSLKADIGAIDVKIGGLQNSVDSLRQDLLSLTDKVTGIEVGQVGLQKRCTALEEANSSLNNETRQMRLKILDLEQHSRCENLEIVGIPVTEGEDMVTLLNSLARAVKVPFTSGDISVAHRLRLFSRKHNFAPIIVQFISRTIKESWLRAARQKRKLSASEVSTNFPESAVFINDHLTSENKALLGRARRLYREKKILFAGVRNGKVLIKPRDSEFSVRVVEMSDLDRYDK